MSHKIILKINGIDVSDLVLDIKWGSGFVGSTVESTLKSSLKKDHSLLSQLDLRGLITLEVTQDGKNHPQFQGVITHTDANSICYSLECNDPNQLLQESRVAGGFGNGMSPAEIVYYLTAEVMPEVTRPENFHVDDNQTLADTGLIGRKRKFVYVAPLPFCKLDVREIKIANAWLYVADNKGSADDQYIAQIIKGQEESGEWAEGGTRVRMYVQARDFLEAFARGNERLQNLLDILSFGTNYSTPTYQIDDVEHFHRYDRSRTIVDIRETPWAFVRETFNANRHWLHWASPHRSSNPFTLGQNDPFLDFYPVFQSLLEEDKERLSDRQKTLLNALHALRECRQVNDTMVALSHIWRCVEYLSSGRKVEKLFSSQERKQLIDSINQHFINLTYSSDNEKTEKQQERAVKLVNSLNEKLNEPSLRVKWNAFVEAHNVQLHKEDECFLWRLREIRNDDQHGRSSTVSRQDIERAAVILEKALVAAVNKEKTETSR